MALGSNSINQVELSGNPDIDALLTGHRWANVVVTYSFPTSQGEYSYHAITGFESFNVEQRAATDQIVANLNAVCGLNIVPGGPGSNIRLAEATTIDYTQVDAEPAHGPGGENDSAEASPPQPDASYRVGDTWYNHSDYNNPVAGTFAYAGGLMHEIGHAVGLAHGHETDEIEHSHGVHPKPALPRDHDTQEYSIMTYRQYVGEADPNDGNNGRDHAQSLMINDIAALQYLYGAYYGHRSNNSVYSWSPTTGEMSIDGVGQGVPWIVELADGTLKSTVFRTIWDGGGIDTYDFSNYRTDLLVDLNPGGWSTISEDQLALLGNDGMRDQFARGNSANALLHQGNLQSIIENATGGSGNDRLVGNVVGNLLLGNPGRDTLFGNEGNDRLNGGTGADALIGGDGIDQASYVGAFVDGVTADLIFATANSGDAEGDSYDSIENLQGTSFDDDLRGHDGENVLEGGFGGDDQLYGRAGNDLLIGADGDDLLEGGAGADALDGGGGNDTASYLFADSRILADLLFDFRFTNEGDALGDTYVGVENLIGSRFDDDLRGDDAANILSGRGGTDGFNGRGGYDTLIGGRGSDLFFLQDLAYAGQFAGFQYDRVVETPDGGVDTVFVTAFDNPDDFSTSGYTLGDNVEYGQIRGSVAFNLTGNALDNVLTGHGAANRLTGHAGSDYISGNGGIDILIGGAGDDTYVLADNNKASEFAIAAYDQVTEAAGEGNDTIVVEALDNPDTHSSIERYTLGANVENGLVTGGLAFNLGGNELGNGLTGNAAGNLLAGLAGNDLLHGQGGIDGLAGGLGDDTYVLADINKAGEFGIAAYDETTEAAGEGNDTVLVEALDNPDTHSSIEHYALAANIENGIVTGALAFNLTGNELRNRLTGNGSGNMLSGQDGNDMLSGLGGIDVLIGGAGNDRYVLADINKASAFATAAYDSAIEQGGGGIDTVLVEALDNPDTFSGVDGYTLGLNIEHCIVTGAIAFDLAGNELGNRLTGNAGANRLDGNGGNDRLAGLGGNDIYIVDSARDGIAEAAGGGADRVLASVGYSLAAGVHIEALSAAVAAATTAMNLNGNQVANRITGNAGENGLRGNAGDDILVGLAGADRLYGGAGNDVLSGGAGRDGFFFQTALDPAANVDRIADFASADDTIWLDRAIFTALAEGPLVPGAFRPGTAAADASDRIVYDRVTGSIFYDADGAGGAAQILFARVDPGTALSRADFAAYQGPAQAAAEAKPPAFSPELTMITPSRAAAAAAAEWIDVAIV
jgi:Ca2+-binding RTX toxin-like protein